MAEATPPQASQRTGITGDNPSASPPAPPTWDVAEDAVLQSTSHGCETPRWTQPTFDWNDLERSHLPPIRVTLSPRGGSIDSPVPLPLSLSPMGPTHQGVSNLLTLSMHPTLTAAAPPIGKVLSPPAAKTVSVHSWRQKSAPGPRMSRAASFKDWVAPPPDGCAHGGSGAIGSGSGRAGLNRRAPPIRRLIGETSQCIAAVQRPAPVLAAILILGLLLILMSHNQAQHSHGDISAARQSGPLSEAGRQPEIRNVPGGGEFESGTGTRLRASMNLSTIDGRGDGVSDTAAAASFERDPNPRQQDGINPGEISAILHSAESESRQAKVAQEESTEGARHRKASQKAIKINTAGLDPAMSRAAAIVVGALQLPRPQPQAVSTPKAALADAQLSAGDGTLSPSHAAERVPISKARSAGADQGIAEDVATAARRSKGDDTGAEVVGSNPEAVHGGTGQDLTLQARGVRKEPITEGLVTLRNPGETLTGGNTQLEGPVLASDSEAELATKADLKPNDATAASSEGGSGQVETSGRVGGAAAAAAGSVAAHSSVNDPLDSERHVANEQDDTEVYVGRVEELGRVDQNPKPCGGSPGCSERRPGSHCSTLADGSIKCSMQDDDLQLEGELPRMRARRNGGSSAAERISERAAIIALPGGVKTEGSAVDEDGVLIPLPSLDGQVSQSVYSSGSGAVNVLRGGRAHVGAVGFVPVKLVGSIDGGAGVQHHKWENELRLAERTAAVKARQVAAAEREQWTKIALQLRPEAVSMQE